MTTTNERSQSAGMARKICSSGSWPPADAPIPTVKGNVGADFSFSIPGLATGSRSFFSDDNHFIGHMYVYLERIDLFDSILSKIKLKIINCFLNLVECFEHDPTLKE